MTHGFGKAVAEVALDEVKGDAEQALAWLKVPDNLASAESKAEGQKLTVRVIRTHTQTHTDT